MNMQHNIIRPSDIGTMTKKGLKFLFLGSTPNDEECTQAGQNFQAQIIECQCLISQFRRLYGPEPTNAEFFILMDRRFLSGITYEVVISYLPQKRRLKSLSEQYAKKCELGTSNWDEIALRELKEQRHPDF
jgi:hypothetical protein